MSGELQTLEFLHQLRALLEDPHPGLSTWVEWRNKAGIALRDHLLELLPLESNPSSPEDIRARGWSVAVHNDYRQDGESYTFWLFTKDSLAVKGEGRTDAEALNAVRKQLAR